MLLSPPKLLSCISKHFFVFRSIPIRIEYKLPCEMNFSLLLYSLKKDRIKQQFHLWTLGLPLKLTDVLHLLSVTLDFDNNLILSCSCRLLGHSGCGPRCASRAAPRRWAANRWCRRRLLQLFTARLPTLTVTAKGAELEEGDGVAALCWVGPRRYRKPMSNSWCQRFLFTINQQHPGWFIHV